MKTFIEFTGNREVTDPKTGAGFEFHPCRNCGHAPTVRPNSVGWLCVCVNGKCPNRMSASGKTLRECWEMWERL